ncbi:MAG: PilZ domain-containing protein [Nitrospinae bacterium]|nr:PilZ domain-containing protein [Nitrospinota bacterium]
MEKREEETSPGKGEKLKISLPVDCLCEEQEFTAKVIELSRDGASLESKQEIAVGSRITLWFALPNPEVLAPLEFTGKVVSASGGTMEVSFVASSPQDEAIITGFIERSLASSRKSPRVPIGLKVDYKCGEAWATGQIEDISEGGLFLLAHSPLRPGEGLLLQFLPPHLMAGRPIRVIGEVTRMVKLDSQKGGEAYSIGLGIKFKSIHSQSRGDFAQYIKKLTEVLDARKTEREAPTPSPEKAAELPSKKTERREVHPEEPAKKSVFDSLWKHLKGKK